MDESIRIPIWKRSQKDVSMICNVFHPRVKDVFLVYNAVIVGEVWDGPSQRPGWYIQVDNEEHLKKILDSLKSLKEKGVDLTAEE